MADVSVIAPDGTPGSIPEEQLKDAVAQGYRADLPAAGPGSAPVVDQPQAEPEVEVRAPDGTVGTVPSSQLEDAVAQGYEDLRGAQYRTTGQKLATVGEGLARGATMGASDAVQTAGAGLGTGIGNWLADKLVGETPRTTSTGLDAPVAPERPLFDTEAAKSSYADIQGRREANKALAVGSEIAGAVVPGLLSGGVGSAAAAARATPAGQLAALSTKIGGLLMKPMGSSAVGRIGALAVTGAGEGLVDSATRTVMDELAKGDVATSSERMLEAASNVIESGAKGVLFGGALGGGLGALAEGVGAAARGAKKILEKLPSVEDFANGRAFKAALGRTNKALVDRAERFGGAEAIGETLNKMGVTKGAAGVETIAERTGELRQKIGQEIGDMVQQAAQNGGPGPSRADLAQRIYSDVIDPLAKDAAKRPVARQLEGRIKDIIDDLTAPGSDAIGLEQLNDLRKSMDDVAAWGKRAPSESDQAYMDVRNVISEYWGDAAQKAADAAGDSGFATRLKQLKRDYSHIAFANDAAEDAVRAKLSNRFASPSDYGVGAAAAVATGGMSLGTVATGMAGAAANKLIREHANSLVASTLYKLASGGVAKEKALGSAVDATLRNFALPATSALATVPGRIATAAPENMQQVKQLVAQSRALQDPNSPESQQLDAMTFQLASESPEFAQAVRDKVMQRATFVVQKLGPSTDPNDPLKVAPNPVDRVTRGRTERFVRAAADPSAALDRLANGTGSAEDLAVVKELTPGIHKAYVDRVMAQVMGKGIKANARQRQKLFFALGTPVERSQTPEYVAYYQSLYQGQQPPPEQGQQQAKKVANKTRDNDMDATSGLARADQLMSVGEK